MQSVPGYAWWKITLRSIPSSVVLDLDMTDSALQHDFLPWNGTDQVVLSGDTAYIGMFLYSLPYGERTAL
jgi:hypothetical protein